MGSETVRLTSLSHGAGCACKLSMNELADVLTGVGGGVHPDLQVGFQTGDDAAVWNLSGGQSVVATTDFFSAIVDDPFTFGQIAATNAVSDIFAMGAVPLFALNVLGWPRALPFEMLRELLLGASDVAERAGYVIAGGHSIDSAEPLYGQAVVGHLVKPPLTNAGGRAGHALVLSKPIGTGVATTAAKRCDAARVQADDAVGRSYRAAVASMTKLNDVAADVARRAQASACTDVTGFGLLGHAHRLGLASGVLVDISASAVPILTDVGELVNAGFVPSGTQRNLEQAQRFLSSDVSAAELTVLADAQTSGGLLFACPRERVSEALATLLETGHVAAEVGRLSVGAPGQVVVGK